jgi:hypothetical protein
VQEVLFSTCAAQPTNMAPASPAAPASTAPVYVITNVVVFQYPAPPKTTNNWPGIVSVLIAGIVAVVGLQQWLLARQQHLLAREKFKLDLFDKRFAVYKSAQQNIVKAIKAQQVRMEEAVRFGHDAQDAVFLFGPEIEKYLEMVYVKIADLSAVQSKYAQQPTPQEHKEIKEQEKKLVGELTSELRKLSDVFGPYLKFKVWTTNDEAGSEQTFLTVFC